MINERLLRHQHREAARRLGESIRSLREDAGLTQATVAREARVNQSHLSRIETGLAEPSILVLRRLATVLGADLAVRVYPNTGPRIRDRLSVPMTNELLRVTRAHWAARLELPVYQPVRGVIDAVLESRTGPTTLETELHSQLRRIEQQVRWQAQKADALAALPEQAGRRVSSLLVLRNTASVREAVRAAAAMLETAYPARTRDAVASLADGTPWTGPAIVWMEVEGASARLLDRAPRGVSVGR